MPITSIFEVLSSVEEPDRNSVSVRLRNDFADLFPSFLVDISCSLGEIDFSNVTDDVRHSSTYTSDGSDGVDYVSLPFDVGVVYSDDMLEFFWFFANETLTHTCKYL